MSAVFKRLVTAQLTTLAVNYYAATNIKTRITAMTLTNTTAGAITATVYLVPSGGTADGTNTILSAKSINAGESYRVIEAIGQDIMAGGSIQALASANTSIAMVASGTEA